MSRDEKAKTFHALHQHGPLLVLPNAWDAASAKIFALEGARALATSSSAIAWTLGYGDGEFAPRDVVLAALGRIIVSVDVPVSVDLVAGYGKTPAAAAETVRLAIEAGAVGANLEDATEEPAVLADKIRAVRETVKGPFFVNARTDWYLFVRGTPEERFVETVRRIQAYEAAGADGIFVPGVGDPATLASLLRETRLPLNVLAGPGVPPVGELERIGVRRLTIGGGGMRAVVALTRRIARGLFAEGTYDAFLAGTPSHAEVDRLFVRSRG